MRGEQRRPDVDGGEDPGEAVDPGPEQPVEKRDALRSGEVVARARRGVLRPLERDHGVERAGVRALGDERDRPVRRLCLPRLPPGLTHVVLAAPRRAGEVAVHSAGDLDVRRLATGLDPGLEARHLEQVVELEAPQAGGA